VSTEETVTVVGAGPASLAAAITLAQAGRHVVAHDAQPNVGLRFQGDLQGLENWTTEMDVLDVLAGYGMTTQFNYLPCSSGTAFDAWGRSYPIRDDRPLFYLVERGPAKGTLDSAMLSEALALGVEVRFNSRLTRFTGPGVLAIGPRAADVIAVGYHFETDMQNGFWVICDDELAPKGYAYLLVWNGRGTVKSCMFSGFKQERTHVELTVKAFEKLVGLTMRNNEFHGGIGNFPIPARAYSGDRPIVGEQAGFQDTLWGFGMRYGILSGFLAAQSILQQRDFDVLWREAMADQLETSIVNRAIVSLLGNRGYRWFLNHQSNQAGVRAFLRRQYNPNLIKRLLRPLARRRVARQRKDKSCDHVNCECVWCRCGSK